MNRRQILSAIGSGTTVSLTGCIGSNNQNSRKEVLVSGVFDVPEDIDISFEVEQNSSILDSVRLPEITVTLTNDGETSVSVSGWSDAIIDDTESDPPGLKLISERHRETIETQDPAGVHSDGCLTVESFERATVGGTTLEPGDSETDRVSIIGDHEAFDQNCIKPINYTVSQLYKVQGGQSDEERTNKDHPCREFSWGIIFEVK